MALEMMLKRCVSVMCRGIIGNWGRSITPVNAVTGGILAQEVLKAVTGQGLPLSNVFAFDGHSGPGYTEAIGVTTTEQQ